MTPSTDIEKLLFSGSVEKIQFAELVSDFTDILSFVNYGDFGEIHRLNTPGPIYTTYTDNCGTGQVEAMNNVGSDDNWREIIFKQPFTRQELRETLSAAYVDPFGEYYFDGNQNWTKELINDWWLEIEERVAYVCDRYEEELTAPAEPQFGRRPIPENYKNWLDFYQNGLKKYLEWYISKICNQQTILRDINVDWTRKNRLDDVLKSKKNGM